MGKVHHMRDEAVYKTLNVKTQLTYFTYLLTPCRRVLLEKLIGFQPVKKFPAFYGTRRFITTFTSARLLSLSWASSIQNITPGPRLSVLTFRNVLCFNGEELLALRPNPKLEGTPLVGCQRLHILYICSYPPYWRPFLHPQQEDGPCRGDRGPLVTQNWT